MWKKEIQACTLHALNNFLLLMGCVWGIILLFDECGDNEKHILEWEQETTRKWDGEKLHIARCQERRAFSWQLCISLCCVYFLTGYPTDESKSAWWCWSPGETFWDGWMISVASCDRCFISLAVLSITLLVPLLTVYFPGMLSWMFAWLNICVESRSRKVHIKLYLCVSTQVVKRSAWSWSFLLFLNEVKINS